MVSGIVVIAPRSTAIFSAKAPKPDETITLSPFFKSEIIFPISVITPEASPPGAKGSSGLNWYLSSIIKTSGKLTDAEYMSTKTKLSSILGSSISRYVKLSGGPYFSHKRAFIIIS